jgi:UDP-glucose 4-epimerase
MGSHICRALVSRGHAVRIFDKTYASRHLIVDFANRVEFFEGDIGKTDDVLNAVSDAYTVIDLVHTTVPGSSMADASFDIETNVVAAEKWLRRLNQTAVRRLLYISSGGTVYGNSQYNPIDESHPTNPICSYGITKLAIEKYIYMYSSLNGFEGFIVRPSNVYGPGQRLHIGQGVIGVMADRAVRGLPLEVWGEGTDLRDYLFIDDFVAAIMSLLDYQGHDRIFNVSTGRGHSVLEIIEFLRKILGSLPEVRHLPNRGFDVPSSILDSSLLQEQTGWRPTIDLQEGLLRTARWLKGSLAANP